MVLGDEMPRRYLNLIPIVVLCFTAFGDTKTGDAPVIELEYQGYT